MHAPTYTKTGQSTTTGPYFYGAATLLQIYKYAHSSIYLHHDPFSRYDFHNLASLPVDAYTRKKSALKTVEMMEICNMCLFRVYKSVSIEKNLFSPEVCKTSKAIGLEVPHRSSTRGVHNARADLPRH